MTLLLLKLEFSADNKGALGMDKQRIRRSSAVFVQYNGFREDETRPVVGVFVIGCKWFQYRSLGDPMNVGVVKRGHRRVGYTPPPARHFEDVIGVATRASQIDGGCAGQITTYLVTK